jgi:hypothetical protein
MPVAGGPFIQKTGILLEVDAANASSYSSGSSTWVNVFRPGTNNGTINGTVGFNSSDSYGALTFPGTASSFVDFGNIGNLSSAWSFQVAVKPAPSASGVYTILSYTSGSGTGSLTFELDYSSSTQTAVLMVYSTTGSAQIVHTVTGSVPTGSWSIINASYGSSVLALNVNGIPTSFVLTTGSTVGYSTNNRLYLGGTFGTTSSFYTGSLASFISYTTDVQSAQLIKNYNAFATRFSRPPSILNAIITDPDAYNFIETTLITDATQQLAINNLVVGLKANNLWDKMQAVYPFIGGTAYSHKFNLKDPRDIDSAFRLQYFGTITHTSLGLSGSSNGYVDTYYNPYTQNPEVSSSAHISTYATTRVNDGWLMINTEGYSDQSGFGIHPNQSLNSSYNLNFGNNKSLSGATSTQVGFYLAARTSLTNVAFYRRVNTGNSSVSTTGTYATPFSSTSIKLLGKAGLLIGGIYGGAIGFTSIGYGLTETDVINLDNVVSAFQSTLGRKPF